MVLFSTEFLFLSKINNMKENIIFKTQDNKDVISLSDFKLEFDEVLKRVIFRLVVNHEIFKAETITEAEEHDFLNLQRGLNDIYNSKLKAYVFNPIGEQLIIKFNLLETGGIEIDLELKNTMFTGRLSAKFKSDITFLPYLVNDIESVLHMAK